MNPDNSVPLSNAADALGLPAWTVFVFPALPVAAALVAIVRNESSLPVWVVTILLAVSVIAVVSDELPVRFPPIVVDLVGLLALVPVLVTGGDRGILVIAGVIALQAAAFDPKPAPLLVLIGAEGVVVVAAVTDPGMPRFVLGMGAVLAAWIAGLGARKILDLVANLRATERLLAEDAAREERRKMAREVHDVVAHSMTVTMLHVNGALLALHDSPETAVEALERAQRVGSASLEDLRRTVRLLSDSSDPTLGSSVDLVEDLDRLREGFAGAATISLTIEGNPESVPPFVGLTVLRIVQESLTNAIRHAPGADVDARVSVSDDRISMRIENSRGNSKNGREAKSGSGRGLRGIFERAALLGGQVEAGPTKDGWVVSGWVPRALPPGGVSV
jgi:signal transduction histidine kinase